MSYQNRLRLKFAFYNILGMLILATILLIAYFYNKLIETSITIILFFIYRRLFEKQYHAKSLYLCGIISIIVFIIIIHLEVSLTLSILSSVILTFIITLISYYLRDYLDNDILVKNYEKRLKTMNLKRLENLSEDEMYNLFPNIKYSELKIVYEYLHRPKGLGAEEFAYKHDLSAVSIYKYVKKVRDEYNKRLNIEN